MPTENFIHKTSKLLLQLNAYKYLWQLSQPLFRGTKFQRYQNLLPYFPSRLYWPPKKVPPVKVSTKWNILLNKNTYLCQKIQWGKLITMIYSTPSSGWSNCTEHLLWLTVSTIPLWISLALGWKAMTCCPTDKGRAKSVGSPSLVPALSSA